MKNSKKKREKQQVQIQQIMTEFRQLKKMQQSYFVALPVLGDAVGKDEEEVDVDAWIDEMEETP